MTKKNELVIVYSTDSVEAEILKGYLEANGIYVFLKDQFLGTLAPFQAAPGGAGAVKIVVHKNDVEKARDLIQEFQQNSAQD